ncbi:hypothetical protein VIGAN_01469600 [Vigna angularis var. angularis]|uniref:Uncharacterized protein n=1 Tax=Vigna angularis var. angularis TaxID=157739 RepID=A0A0S3R7K4_PHAAN|nr:hypothetical protein VIGAN_01469600 [Vigna angularis var. angularis]
MSAVMLDFSAVPYGRADHQQRRVPRDVLRNHLPQELQIALPRVVLVRLWLARDEDTGEPETRIGERKERSRW